MEKPSEEIVRLLINKLEAASQLPKRGRAYKNTHQVFNSDHKVTSWKFNEWDYGKSNLTLPSNARGLFITEDEQNPEIVVRGYDKFFNIDEVSTTRWDWIESNTMGPYEVTVKENGCIIFISGLKDGTIVVCSKHSTGLREGADKNHALAGENFLRKQLEASGQTLNQLALELYRMNATAVAEYCDDSFEEHILEYTKEKAGLYLHGINFNQPDFQTMPMSEVHRFATEYNFKKIDFFTKPDVASLREFLEDCATKGSYKGMEIEGFVVRCQNKDGNAFFFKYKFEEPYLMYRQWREVTKEYIKNKSRVFRFKKHKFITNKYLDFVIPLLNENPQLCDEYMRGFGVIKLRNAFLKSYGMSGFEILNQERLEELELQNAIDYDKVDERTKFLFIPIATIGCGKTTTALTLQNLFPNTWGHIQNDDITGKDKSMLMKRSLELLSRDEIKAVIVDRNNHQYRERKQLFQWLDELKEDYLPYDANVKVIAFSYLPYNDIDITSVITLKRILARGDNHQSIKAVTDGEKKVTSIMRGFIERYQPVDENKYPDSLFDMVIHLDVKKENSSLKNAKRILEALYEKYQVLIPTVPSDEEISNAFKKSLEYKPKITKIVRSNNKSKEKEGKYKPVYFSANIRVKQSILDEIWKLVDTKRDEVLSVEGIEMLFEENKIRPEFHITLCHVITGKNGTKSQKDIWCEFNKRYSKDLVKTQPLSSRVPKLIKTKDVMKFKLDKLLWDDKIVTIVVKSEKECVYDSTNELKVSRLECANDSPHITIGILQQGIKPFYSNSLCNVIAKEHNNQEGGFPDGTNCLKFTCETEFTADVYINL